MRSTVQIPVYGIYLHLFVEEDFLSLIKKHCPKSHDPDSDNLCKAITILRERNVFVFIKKEHLTYNTIAHELDHVTHLLLRDIGLSESDDSEEAYAYLTGWLHGWTYETLRDKGAKIYYQDKKEPKI
jgi:hypothetical protein